MENTLNNSLRQSEHSPHPSDPSYFPSPMYPSLNIPENECHPHQQLSRHPAASGINHDFHPFFPLTEDQTHSPTNDIVTLESPEQRSMLLQMTERSHNEPSAPSLGLHIRQESLVGGAESQATSFLPNLLTARSQISSNIRGILSPLPLLPEDGAYNPVAAYAAAPQQYACFPVMPMIRNPQSRPQSRSQDDAYRSPTDCVVNQPSFRKGSRIPSVVWNTHNGVLPFPDYQSPVSVRVGNTEELTHPLPFRPHNQGTTGTPASRPRQSERRALTRSMESNQFPLPLGVDHETCALVDAALAASSIPSPPMSSPAATNANYIDPLCRCGEGMSYGSKSPVIPPSLHRQSARSSVVHHAGRHLPHSIFRPRNLSYQALECPAQPEGSSIVRRVDCIPASVFDSTHPNPPNYNQQAVHFPTAKNARTANEPDPSITESDMNQRGWISTHSFPGTTPIVTDMPDSPFNQRQHRTNLAYSDGQLPSSSIADGDHLREIQISRTMEEGQHHPSYHHHHRPQYKSHHCRRDNADPLPSFYPDGEATGTENAKHPAQDINRAPCTNCSSARVKCDTKPPNSSKLCKKCKRDGLAECPPHIPRPKARKSRKYVSAHHSDSETFRQIGH